MGKALLLNMKDYTIVKEFETMDAAYVAQDEPQYQGFPKHLVDREEWDLTAVDLVKFYNVLVPQAPVKRFETRAVGMARLLRVLNGEILPATDETVIKEATRKKRTGKLQTDGAVINVIEEKAVKTKKAKKTPAAKKSATPRVATDLESNIKPLKKGLEKHWQKESVRAKLFAYIRDKGEATVGALIKFGESKLNLDAGKVRAALGIMARDENVKVSG
jgi:hypothetical protein